MLEKLVAKTHQIQGKNSNFRREMDKRHSNVYVLAIDCSHHPLFTFSEHFFFLFLIRRWLGQTDLQISTKQIIVIESIHGINGFVTVLEMDKSVILYFLHPVDFAMFFENFLKFFFCYSSRQISDVKNFHLKFFKNV